MSARPGRTARARWLRWGLLALVVVVVGAFIGYTGYQAVRAKQALHEVAADFQMLRGQLASGDTAGAAQTVRAAQHDSARARDLTRGPGWWLAGKLPGVGADVYAVRTAADVTYQLSSNVLPDVVRAARVLRPDRLRPRHGRIHVAPIRAVAPTVVSADRALHAQAARVLAIDTGNLAGQIAGPISTLQAKLADAVALADHASLAVRLLPQMLGAKGPRTYLFMFQNNAEARATGGIAGSIALVTADHGKLSLGEQGGAATIGHFDRPVLPLTHAEKRLFGARLAEYPQDVNLTPNFPRSAELIAAMWNARHQRKVDGVVSADPVALSYLLAGTGPVHLDGGHPLTASNAVSLLLNRVYFQIADPRQQNPFFNSVARKVFEALTAGRGRPRGILHGLTKAADEHRLLVWSTRPAEQGLLAPTAISGELPTQPTGAPQVGVYLDDASGAKMDYYLHYRVDMASTGCRAGRQQLRLTLRMRSAVPADTRRLPDYIVAPAVHGPRGTFLTTVYFYLPAGGRLRSLAIDGQPQPFSVARHDGRPVMAQTVTLAPGERHTLVAAMVGGAGQRGAPLLRTTPGANGTGAGQVTPSACDR